MSEAARERTAHLSFLTDSYETQCFWFEVAECARRLMLSSVLILFEQGDSESVFQKVIALGICLFSLRMYTYYKPYEDNDDDLLAEAAIWQYLAILFVALLIHVDAAPGEQEHLGLLLIFISCIGFAIMMFALLHVLFREILREIFGGRVSAEKSKSSKVTPALPPVEEHADETSPADNSSNDSNNNRQTLPVVDATNDDSSSMHIVHLKQVREAHRWRNTKPTQITALSSIYLKPPHAHGHCGGGEFTTAAKDDAPVPVTLRLYRRPLLWKTTTPVRLPSD